MRARLQFGTLGTLLAVQLCWAATASAQLPIPASTQFDITGFLQEATLDIACVADAHCGGSLTVNGHIVVVPKQTIVILPANALTWQELFAQAPVPYGLLTVPASTGLALADLPQPLTTYEVHVVGNRVIDPVTGTDRYIAGLIYISQQGLNSGAGFINFIDYALGEMRVGGVLNDPLTGARVRINDPVNAAIGTGRFSLGVTPDKRFTVDQDNPTIISATGFPMCLPRVAPPASDPLCPQGNRPLTLVGTPPVAVFAAAIEMPDPATIGVTAPPLPDPRIQAPFEVGDYITFAGTMVTDNPLSPTIGPYTVGTPNANTFYISAHTITSNVGIWTAPGTNPAYVMTEVTLIGTGGLTVIGAGEAVIRTRFEGMTTDPSRNIHLYGIDLDPLTGATTDRDWGTIGVDPGPPTGAVKGRWRFRPPCAPFGTVVAKPDKQCVMNAAGTFLPPTREMRAVVEGLQSQNPASPTAVTSANGIFYGQYHAPILEYIFPENIPGTPIVENNFNTIDFLAKGGYTSSAGTLAGVLNPWPSNVTPVGGCVPPTASAGGPYSVASTGVVTLAATATGTGPFTVAWATPSAGTLSDPGILTPVFTAPAAAQTVPLTVTVTGLCGTSTSNTSVTVNAATAPTVNHIPALTQTSGFPVTMTATGVDPNGLPLTFVWTQTGTPVVLNPNPFTGATINFTLTLPLGAPSVTLQFSVVATNSAGVSSAPEFTTVTINPVADTVTITSVEYRTGKQRLIVNATSSVISPNVVLTLQPYLTTQGVIFDPASLGNLFTNNGGGLYIITVVGAPEPALAPAAVITVKSNLGGLSAPSPVTKLRP